MACGELSPSDGPSGAIIWITPRNTPIASALTTTTTMVSRRDIRIKRQRSLSLVSCIRSLE